MKQLWSLVILLLLLAGCTAYKSQYVPFRPPEQYANHQNVTGVSVGCQAYPDRQAAKKAFGFDIRGAAGLLPVMLVLDNRSGQAIQILASQSFLVDAWGNYWPVVPNNVAFDRMEKATRFAGFLGGTGKGALLGAAAGGLLASAVGVVSGDSVASFLGKGAAMGGAAGAVLGGVAAGGSDEYEYRIKNDLREKGLEGRSIPDQYLANGFLFFPGEAKSAIELRLEWRERDSDKIRRAILPLGPGGS